MSTLEAVRTELRSMTRVVQALPEDAFAIHKTLLCALAESETDYPEPDMPYCIQALLDLIAQGFVAVARDADTSRVVGCIALDIAHWPWVAPKNPKGRHLYNQHLWIEPRHRSGGVATQFIDFAKDLSDRRGLPLILELTSIDSANSDLRDRFVRIQGFTYTGGKFYRAPAVSVA